MSRHDPVLGAVAVLQTMALMGLSIPALAEKLPTKLLPATQSPADTVVEEIIVTATRREASLHSVPMSISVLSAEALQRLGATGFVDYAGSVPGLSFVDPGWGGEQHTIRGIRLNPILPEINPVTALYLDDVPIIGSGILGNYHADPVLVDIERVEVLRGPQGTLFGASAMSGAIRVITAKPEFSETQGFLDTAVSTMNDGGAGYDIHGMFNAPLVQDKAAIRATGYLRRESGFIDNLATGDEDVNDKDVAGGRLAAAFRIGDQTRVAARVAYQERKSDGISFEQVGLPPRHQRNLPEQLTDRWTNYNLTVEANLGWANLASSTSYLNRQLDATLDISAFADAAFGVSNPIWTEIPSEDHEFVQELRLTSTEDGRFLWVAGAFYQDFDQDLFQTMPAPGLDAQTGGLAASAGLPDNLLNARYSYSLDQFAVYADLSFAITDRLEVGSGARWYEIDRDYTSESVGLFAGDPVGSGATSESGIAPRFSLRFAASEDLTVYASAAEGFRWGGINTPEGSDLPECQAELLAIGMDEFPIGYGSDGLWSYEFGIKSRWYADRFRLNAVAYHIDWTDMQTSKYLDCGIFFVENAGDARSDGVELELDGRLSDRWLVNINAQYDEAVLDEDVASLGASAGDRIPAVPRLAGSISVQYEFTAFGRDSFVRGDYRYNGQSYSDFNPANRRELPAYEITNLRGGLGNETWMVTLFIDNVFDERGITGLEDSNLRYAVTTTRPRTAGVSARWVF